MILYFIFEKKLVVTFIIDDVSEHLKIRKRCPPHICLSILPVYTISFNFLLIRRVGGGLNSYLTLRVFSGSVFLFLLHSLLYCLFFSSLLFFSLLYSTILYYTILYSTLFYSALLFSSFLSCPVLSCPLSSPLLFSPLLSPSPPLLSSPL